MGSDVATVMRLSGNKLSWEGGDVMKVGGVDRGFQEDSGYFPLNSLRMTEGSSFVSSCTVAGARSGAGTIR
jgi:hypothetical protein